MGKKKLEKLRKNEPSIKDLSDDEKETANSTEEDLILTKSKRTADTLTKEDDESAETSGGDKLISACDNLNIFEIKQEGRRRERELEREKVQPPMTTATTLDTTMQSPIQLRLIVAVAAVTGKSFFNLEC